MDAVIRIPATEFNETIFKQIEDMVKGKNADIIIAVKEKDQQNLQKETDLQYWSRIDRSILDLEAGRGISFTMDAFEKFISSGQ